VKEADLYGLRPLRGLRRRADRPAPVALSVGGGVVAISRIPAKIAS